MPTKVFIGRDCLKQEEECLEQLGKKAIIVTGKTSGRKSGALGDVVEIMQRRGIDYCIFDKVENNPSIENVMEGGAFAREEKADFVIGIGGGSPLDAAKAIAVLAVNDMDAEGLYSCNYDKVPIPIAAIPTTAGTGSEVTPTSVLTYRAVESKKSFTTEWVFPKYAFLDATYTMNLPKEVTVNTAIDALSHAIEGYLSLKSSITTDYIALESIRIFGECIDNLLLDKMDFDIRQKLLYSSMLAGIVIAHTGTTIVHSMGYSLTYFKDVPHGRANALLLPEYLRFNYCVADKKIDRILQELNMKNIDDFENLINELVKNDKIYTRDEIEKFAGIAIKARNVINNPRKVTLEDEIKILENSLCKA